MQKSISGCSGGLRPPCLPGESPRFGGHRPPLQDFCNRFYYARYNLAQALELKGLIPEATAEYEKTMSMTDDPVPLGMLGRLYALHGRKDEALKILQRLRERREQRYTAAYSLVLIYVGLDNRNEALNRLEKGYREHDGFNIGPIRVDPLLAPLRGNLRFEALAEKIVPAREFGKAVTQK